MLEDKNKSGMHRITKEDEILIYELIEEKLTINTGDSAAIRKEKEVRREAFNRFKEKNTPIVKGRPRKEGPRRLCYEQMDEIVETTGVSYFDILNILSKDPDGNKIVPQWPTKSEADMCSYCSIMTDRQMEVVLTLVKRVLAEIFTSGEVEEENPMLRLYKASSSRTFCIKEMGRKMKELEVADAFARRYMPYSYNALELNLVTFMSTTFDVSPHWLLKLDENTTVLAPTGKIEMIMDLFCFLPNERKEIILAAAEAMTNEGGTA